MKKLKCESCGANLVVEENGRFAHCEYCNLKYQLDDQYGYKLIEDITKGTRKASVFVKYSAIVIFLLAAFVFIGIIVSSMLDRHGYDNEISKAEIRSFNSPIELYATSSNAFFVESLLDNVAASNGRGKRVIKVSFLDKKDIVSRDDILDLKDELNFGVKYRVDLKYDSDGFINKVIIRES